VDLTLDKHSSQDFKVWLMNFPSLRLHIGVSRFKEARKEGKGTFTTLLKHEDKKIKSEVAWFALPSTKERS